MKLKSFCADDTKKIGHEIATNAAAGDIFCLHGTLGAGKTIFAQGFARALGYEKITSPTFGIVNEYTGGKFPLYHFDLYRLEGDADLENIGCEEYFFSDGICLVEWAERASFPENAVRVKIFSDEQNENHREICIENLSD